MHILGNDSTYRQYASDLSNFTPWYLDSEQKGRISLLQLTFSSHLFSLSNPLCLSSTQNVCKLKHFN